MVRHDDALQPPRPLRGTQWVLRERPVALRRGGAEQGPAPRAQSARGVRFCAEGRGSRRAGHAADADGGGAPCGPGPDGCRGDGRVRVGE